MSACCRSNYGRLPSDIRRLETGAVFRRSRMRDQSERVTYVIITPARDEAEFIENTIQSVIRQSALPAKWVIVNDGSTDDTASIVRGYAATYGWMELVNLPAREGRSFAAKAQAFKAGEERLKGIGYEVIGNLDADVTLDDD